MEENDQRTGRIGFEFYPRAVILGGGDFPQHPFPSHLLEQAPILVCCDGAANLCLKHHLTPWCIVGDGDSLSDEAREVYEGLIHINPDQETNDQTKAVRYLQKQGIRRIALVGATGRREDHTLGNISLLMDYQRQGLEVRMYTDYGVFIPCQGMQSFQCPWGTAVSVFSFGTRGMTSEGLAYPLYDFTSLWQGTLNHNVSETFTIQTEGEYLVYLAYENKKVRE